MVMDRWSVSFENSWFPNLRPHQPWTGTLGDRQEPLLCFAHLSCKALTHLDSAFRENHWPNGLCSQTYFSICTVKMTILLNFWKEQKTWSMSGCLINQKELSVYLLLLWWANVRLSSVPQTTTFKRYLNVLECLPHGVISYQAHV